ncbi:MAG TPA: hypothetical protein VED01_07760 [Burkholderiales bacterium]|nr:hypothetical protein [Burkholderiales bacterium]
MASSIIGRTSCPECDFESAHVKIKTDATAGKEPLPYRYCPGCGAAYHPRSKAAAQALLKKTRLEQQAAPAAAARAPAPATDPAPESSSGTAEEPKAAAPAKTGGWLGGLNL